jgi:sulfopropanediol 3-dehydrogenase
VKYLKRGIEESEVAAIDGRTRGTVEEILANVRARGDAAVRELSERFDQWSPTSFHLSERDIEAAMSNVSRRDLEDIRFAQTQVRNFAQLQRESIRDIEVETLPGVILGHKNIPT